MLVLKMFVGVKWSDLQGLGGRDTNHLACIVTSFFHYLPRKRASQSYSTGFCIPPQVCSNRHSTNPVCEHKPEDGAQHTRSSTSAGFIEHLHYTAFYRYPAPSRHQQLTTPRRVACRHAHAKGLPMHGVVVGRLVHPTTARNTHLPTPHSGGHGTHDVDSSLCTTACMYPSVPNLSVLLLQL